MNKIIRNTLQQLIDDFDVGNTNIEEEEAVKIVRLLQDLRSDVGISKYSAYKYLRISRAQFDTLVKEGKIPRGAKVAGFNELRWYKRDLDKYIESKNKKK